MKKTEHKLKSGKTVKVFDNYIPLYSRLFFYDFCMKSNFIIGWGDSSSEVGVKHKFLHSDYSLQDNVNGRVYLDIMDSEIANEVAGLTLSKSVVNLSMPSDTNFAHAHPEKKVVLYYVNPEWPHYWHGETLFYDESLENIELALRYTPGRVIVFDGDIPHAIRPQSASADHYRFTYALIFN